jgi:hypothetical protein
MMKRTILLVLIVLALIAVFPAAAQDEEVTQPDPCTVEQLGEAVTAIQSINEKVQTATQASQSLTTAEEQTASLLAWGDAYMTYMGETYATFPYCIDGAITADLLGLMLNQQLTLSSMSLLSTEQIAAGDDDEDLTAAMVETATAQGSLLQNSAAGFSQMSTSLKSGTPVPNWLPACTDEQNEYAATLDEYENAFYTEQRDALEAFIEDGTVDPDAYLTIVKLVNSLGADLSKGSGGCAELYYRTLNNIVIFNDALTAMSIGLTVPYLEGTDAEAVTTLRDQFGALLALYISPQE